jgi:glycosyltransferase involved in cell wall biosynthesis
MNAPIVSVLTTVYNREKYLPECIESVLASSFRDFEYIIVDDVSTDSSYDIAREYAKQDPRIKVYRNETNLGDYPNRNKAASYASGIYLKYVDSDDIIYPHGLQVMLTAMERFPEAVYALSCHNLPGHPLPLCLSPRETYLTHYLKRISILSRSPLSSIFKRKSFEEIGGFQPLRMTGDFALWHDFALKAPVVLMPSGLAWYREHAFQEVTDMKTNRVKYRIQYNQIALRALKQARQIGILQPIEYTQIVRQESNLQSKAAIKLLFKLDFFSGLKLLRDALALKSTSR